MRQLREPQQQYVEVSEQAVAQAETPQFHAVPHHRHQDLRRLPAAARQHTEDRHRPHLRQALQTQEVHIAVLQARAAVLLQAAAITEAVHLQAAATTEAAADTAEAALHQEVTDVN